MRLNVNKYMLKLKYGLKISTRRQIERISRQPKPKQVSFISYPFGHLTQFKK